MLDNLPRSHFAAICADPPWRFVTYSDKGAGRSASQHYNTMSIDDIKAMPVAEIAAKDCFLFLWGVWPHLREALEVLEAWGFSYSGVAFTWVKTHKSIDEWPQSERDLFMGLGYTTRKNTEFVLLGRRGKPVRKDGGVREVIVAARRAHSEKPEEFYARVETFCDGPYLDLFSRKSRPGWSAFGDQAGKFDSEADALAYLLS